MPRFLHTSDFHINALRKFDNYLDRVELTLDEIVKVARAQAVDFIVVAGDITDRRDVSHSERKLLSSWLSSVDTPVVMISGNHDKRSADIGDSSINHLSALSTGNALLRHIVHDGAPEVAEYFDCCFVFLPYQGWMDQELFLIMSALQEQYRSSKYPVVAIMHEAVYGCKNDSGFSVTKNNQIRLDVGSFPGVDYWALGDMHKCQAMLPNAWYSGAPHQTRFDEGPDKGVLIVDTDVDVTNPTFIPIRSIPLITLDREPAAGWPSPDKALIHFNPPATDMPPLGNLPNNVKYTPVSTSFILPSRTDDQNSIFDGLDDMLTRANLPPFLFPLAWSWGIKIAKSIGVDVELPDRYQE